MSCHKIHNYEPKKKQKNVDIPIINILLFNKCYAIKIKSFCYISDSFAPNLHNGLHNAYEYFIGLFVFWLQLEQNDENMFNIGSLRFFIKYSYFMQNI